MTCNFNFQSHLQSGVGVTSKLMFVSHLSLSGIDLLAMNEGKSMASFGLSSTDSLTAGSMESVKPRAAATADSITVESDFQYAN